MVGIGTMYMKFLVPFQKKPRSFSKVSGGERQRSFLFLPFSRFNNEETKSTTWDGWKSLPDRFRG